MSILIKGVQCNQAVLDIFIEGNLIKTVGEHLPFSAGKVIDGAGKAAIPGLINGHGHAPMTYFRSFGDDLPLEQWLSEKIWPYEAKVTEEAVYWATKLACVEMIKSGTTCFNDMYMSFNVRAKAVQEMGLRAVLSETIFDFFEEKKAGEVKKQHELLLRDIHQYGSRVKFALGPHAIYTVSANTLRWVRDFAKANGLLIHTHLSETRTEHENALKQFGLSPVRYLSKLGFLSPEVTIAHCLWLDDEEIKILADADVKVVHNPNSNLKLASGFQFKYKEMKAAGITVGIGTDGCSSSNNLDMVEAMKVASLMQKAWRYDPTAMPAQEALDCATVNGARILGLNAGKIEEGRLADICLIDLNIPAFTPTFDFVSNLVYSANGSCVDTVICDGKIIMENKHVEGEEEIMREANRTAHELMKAPNPPKGA